MTAPRIVDPAAALGQALADASPDLMRHLLGSVINALLSADADAVCGAEYDVASPERMKTRNGYRAGSWTPRPALARIGLTACRVRM